MPVKYVQDRHSRGERWCNRQTHRQTDKRNYSNPHCVCAPRVNYRCIGSVLHMEVTCMVTFIWNIRGSLVRRLPPNMCAINVSYNLQTPVEISYQGTKFSCNIACMHIFVLFLLVTTFELLQGSKVSCHNKCVHAWRGAWGEVISKVPLYTRGIPYMRLSHVHCIYIHVHVHVQCISHSTHSSTVYHCKGCRGDSASCNSIRKSALEWPDKWESASCTHKTDAP